MPPFQLQSLGALRLIGPEGELLQGRRRQLILLVFIARNGSRAVSRQRLAELLWGGRPEARARQSLRQALYRLRAVLGDRLEVDAEHVRLEESAVELDALAFERDVADDRLVAAAGRWTGEFLAGLDDVGGESYRTWLEAEREALRRKLVWALERLVADAERGRAWEEAVHWAEQWSRAFPVDERAATHLVRALAASQRNAEAVACHAAFVARLSETLGAQPSTEFTELGRELTRNPGHGSSPGSSALLAPDLVGRDAALAALDVARREAGASGAVVLVEGSEGIGRSRLCREFLQRLRSSDEEVFLIECQAGDADGERPWATARRLLAGIRHAPGLLGAPDQALSELADVVPSLHERFTDLPEPVGTESARAAALARVLEDVAAETPVVVLIDDLTRADLATRRLLLSLALEIPPGVLLVVAVCTGAVGSAELVGRLQAAPRLQRLKLQPLSEAELETMVDSMLPLEPADRRALAARLYTETGGNPLYTVELASAMADTGLLVPGPTGAWRMGAGLDGGPVPLPAGAREAILARVERLSAAARDLVEAAAVLGYDPDFHLLREVAGLAAPEHAVALDEVLARRILRPPERPGAGYQFGQGLIRRVVEDALPDARRRALHRAALRAHARRRAGADRLHRHRQQAGMAMPALRTWLWRHPRAALAAGIAVLLAVGAIALPLGRAPVTAGPDVVAVFPFTVQGDDELSYAGQAVASLLATSLDGAPSLRSVDPLRLPSAATPELETGIDPRHARRLATRLGAGWFVVGTVIESRGRLRATASLYDTADRRQALAQASADSDDLFTLTDVLARELLSRMHRGPSGQLAQVAASTTVSLEAFKDYLAGEAALRLGHYDEAITAFRRALVHDSTFALASYRMAVAAEWRADEATQHEALSLALRHRHRLPERYRRLAVADSARLAGAADDAERRYREVVARHPDEPLAWYHLGEVLIHFNPMRGRPLAESQHAFERTIELDPDNYEARWHLAQLAASAADTSALARWIAPLLGGSDRDRIIWRTVRDALRGDAEATRRNRDSLRTAGEDIAYAGAWFVPLLAGDPAEGARLARAVAESEPVREWRVGARILAAHAELARGRREAGLRELEHAATLDPTPTLAYRALFATLPQLGGSTTELIPLRDELLRWDATATAGTSVPHPFLSLHDDIYAHLRLYLLGLVRARLGDMQEANDTADRLRQLPATPHAEAFGADLSLAVEAEVARLAGQHQRALALLEAMRMRPSYVAVSFSPFFSYARERFVRAQLLHALGRLEEADRWYASVSESPPFGYVFLGPSLLRRAELHEEWGDTAAARRLYVRFLELWAEADGGFQELLSETRQRIVRLAGESADG